MTCKSGQVKFHSVSPGQGRLFNFFLAWGEFYFYFSMPPDYWKIGKKQHFICSNLTLFIVLFFLFFSFFSLFSFSFFFSFSLGATAPSPLKWRLWSGEEMVYREDRIEGIYAQLCAGVEHGSLILKVEPETQTVDGLTGWRHPRLNTTKLIRPEPLKLQNKTRNPDTTRPAEIHKIRDLTWTWILGRPIRLVDNFASNTLSLTCQSKWNTLTKDTEQTVQRKCVCCLYTI